MPNSPITGYVVVLQYVDRSSLLGAFGPYPTKESAEVGVNALQQMPMAEGIYEVQALFGAPGGPEKEQSVYRSMSGRSESDA